MENSTDKEYASYRKKVWAIYALVVVAVIILLVTFVAQDNEERLFYSLMTAAASYVFRPTDRSIGKAVLRLFGVSPPVESDENISN